MTMETKKHSNGETLYRRFALYHFGLKDWEQEIQWAQPEIDTADPYEISAQVGGREEDDDEWCVEYYWADENGEFVEGSDYDSATAHYKHYHIEEGTSSKIKIGSRYSDPEGEWEVVGRSGDKVEIECIQEENLNFGKRFLVPEDEAEYYIEGGK